MADYSFIRPENDGDARQASSWADALEKKFGGVHSKVADIDAGAIPNKVNVLAALGSSCSAIFYFGHGDEHSWLTGKAILQASDLTNSKSKAVVSIACKTGCKLAPDALTVAGVRSFLAFTSRVAVIAVYNSLDPIGDAIVDGLYVLGSRGTMQQARDGICANLDSVMSDYDIGQYSSHPAANFGYFAAMAMRDHVVLHGPTGFRPL